MRVSILGMGYVGVVSGACLAKFGHHVIGVDVNEGKVQLLKTRRSPIVEVGLDELLAEMVDAGRLTGTTDAATAVADSDVSFISVGTPSATNGLPSFAALDAVVVQIGAAIRNKKDPHTVVVRSTVPPGTVGDRVAPALCRSAGRQLGDGLELCVNPEFLREGNAIKDFASPPFTLAGCSGDTGYETLRQIYQSVDAPFIRTEIRVAESVKYLCNVFHALKIGFANEAGALLKSLGVDGREAMRIFCEDRTLNISRAYLRPGFAFGGSCLPKDVRAFVSLAKAQGLELPLLGNLLPSNAQHIERAFQMIAQGGRRKVALFGLAFKPGTDDLRESPLVALAERLIGKGFELAIFDRHVEIARLVGANREFIDREIPHLERLLKPTCEETLAGAEVIVIGHAAPKEIATISALHDGRAIIDLQGSDKLRSAADAACEGICW